MKASGGPTRRGRRRFPLQGGDDPTPHGRLLSNGTYTTFLTGAGSGFSMRGDTDLTRWRGDRIEDADGFFLYLRDLEDGAFWSAGWQPTGAAVGRYEAFSTPGRVTIVRTTRDLETRWTTCVAPDRDVEIRRLQLRNLSDRPRRIEVTSYAEVVLQRRAAYAAHPAFCKLFVQTELAAETGALLARRRPRSDSEAPLWMAHALVGSGPLELETDRARWLGRGRGTDEPLAMTRQAPLSGTTGSVLDPVLSLRRVVRLAPQGKTVLIPLLAAAVDREEARSLVRHCDRGWVAAAFRAAANRERGLRATFGFTDARAEILQELAGAVLYQHPALGPAVETPERAASNGGRLSRPRSNPELPLIVLHAAGQNKHDLLVDTLKAHLYWQRSGLPTELLVLCDDPETVDSRISHALASFGIQRRDASAPAIRLQPLRDLSSPHDLDLLHADARLVVRDALPSVSSGGNALPITAEPPRAHPTASARSVVGEATAAPSDARAADHDLLFHNGLGGFTREDGAYVIRLGHDEWGALERPPMPWSNVIANPSFGFLVSESGAGCTWNRNSRENRLTPWTNDPIGDPHEEALYVRDDDTGLFWSPQPGPVPGDGPYEIRHAPGYSRWRHTNHRLRQEVCAFVARTDPIKLVRVRLTNDGDRIRRLSLFSYHRWVLGALPEETGRFIVTEIDTARGCVLARNERRGEFSDGVAFAAAVPPREASAVHLTADRARFLGRNRRMRAPRGVTEMKRLEAASGAGLDPCAALQVEAEMAPGETVDCTFLLGEAGSEAEARELIERYRQPAAVEQALDDTRTWWSDFSSGLQIETPVPAIDLMVNDWLPWQLLSCRLWGRSAFHQSGGAIGFRDQLQDAAALVYLRPDLTREQILLHAAHQFTEGDVLHWWHPPLGRGIRTRFSDDLVWLPLIAAFYVRASGDWAVLDEIAPFLAGAALAPGEDEAYQLAGPSGEHSDLYSHCCRALDRALTKGAHGLPLMGSGDWNDGMNRVGREGRGESVWMGFFLYHTLSEFLPLCRRRGDDERAERYLRYRSEVRGALNDAGWDGAWYRRAYYDDGSPLGSAENEECRIDALVQAWAVLSEAAPAQRGEQAMDAVEQHLISESDGLIRLLAPPFDRTTHDPGYIKGYVPGIRENGGQYTHAALWVVRALAELGRRDRATRLLQMLLPVTHTDTPEGVARYQVEPYVVAADVYGVTPHVGRGGWTWYTGSAAWMYRVAVESVLGLTLEGGDVLRLRPRVPDDWPGFRVHYRSPDRATHYEIDVQNPNRHASAVTGVLVDGRAGQIEKDAAVVHLENDGAAHLVRVTLG